MDIVARLGNQASESKTGIHIGEGVRRGLLVDLDELEVARVVDDVGLRELSHRDCFINFQQTVIGQ